MFHAFIFLIAIATGQTQQKLQAHETFADEAACHALIDHDMPTMQAQIDEKYPNTFLLKGECVKTEEETL